MHRRRVQSTSSRLLTPIRDACVNDDRIETNVMTERRCRHIYPRGMVRALVVCRMCFLQRSAALREVDGWRMTVAPISRRDWHNIYRHYMHSCDWAQTYYRCHRVRIFTSQLNWYSYTIYEFFRKFISSYRNGSDMPINSINLIKFNCIYVCMYVCM